jgi:hypothetical protein
MGTSRTQTVRVPLAGYSPVVMTKCRTTLRWHQSICRAVHQAKECPGNGAAVLPGRTTLISVTYGDMQSNHMSLCQPLVSPETG